MRTQYKGKCHLLPANIEGEKRIQGNRAVRRCHKFSFTLEELSSSQSIFEILLGFLANRILENWAPDSWAPAVRPEIKTFCVPLSIIPIWTLLSQFQRVWSLDPFPFQVTAHLLYLFWPVEPLKFWDLLNHLFFWNCCTFNFVGLLNLLCYFGPFEPFQQLLLPKLWSSSHILVLLLTNWRFVSVSSELLTFLEHVC